MLLPLTGLAVVGLWQLRATEPPVTFIRYAVTSPLDLPSQEQTSASLSPPDTRTLVATLLALALLADAGFRQIRTNLTLAATSVVLLGNAIAVGAIGLTQLFHGKDLELNDVWTLGWSRGSGARGFAGFINPNSAAGWLCLGTAIGAGWITWLLSRSSTDPRLRHGRLRVSLAGRLWQRSLEFLADLTVWQILALTATGFLCVSVAATQSRGGILSLVVGVAMTVLLRSSLKQLPLRIGLLAVAALAVFGTLQWLELDEGVVGELETLQDLESAAGSRPRHWRDTLPAVLDFPLTGAGLGSYRFINLPYQTQSTGLWFRNADNHYLDILIEGGIIGLLLFLLIGGCGLAVGLSARSESRIRTTRRSVENPRTSRRVLAGLGTAVLLAVLTQGAAAFLDYGIAMPPAASLLVLLIASAGGFLDSGGTGSSMLKSGILTVGRLAATAIPCFLIVAAAGFLPDQIAAVQLDQPVVDAYRILDDPVRPEGLDQLSDVRDRLAAGLNRRPDDPEGRFAAVRLADAEFRWELIQKNRGEDVRTQPGFEMLWNRVTMSYVIDLLWRLSKADATAAARMRMEVKEAVTETGLPDQLQQLQRAFPLMPGIAERLAEISLAGNDIPGFLQQVGIAQQIEPSNAIALHRLGILAVRADRTDLAKTLWEQSLQLDDSLRSAVLAEALQVWNESDALSLFGPQTYEECVRTAASGSLPKLNTTLWAMADRLWAESTPAVDEVTASARVTHLQKTRRDAEAVIYLEEVLPQLPDLLSLRIHYAGLLEKQERYRDALDQWHRIRYESKRPEQAQAAIDRIRGLSPK
ncbi:MAG: O-antigen ligase family protein [Planctomycetaceae bacterium]